MRYSCISFILLCFFSAVNAQNLVVNPSFEDVNIPQLRCKYYQSYPEFNAAINNWISPSKSTPDISSLSLDSSCMLSPLSDIVGKQKPHSGKNMAGILNYYGHTKGNMDPEIPNYREYIQNKLKQPLRIGKRYRLTYYVSLADHSTVASNNLGAYFSSDPVSNLESYGNWETVTPLFQYSPFIVDKDRWIRIDKYFVAPEAWQYLTIGNFSSNKNTSTVDIVSRYDTDETYYYLDDVSVKEACLEVSADTIICPGSQVKLHAKGEGFLGWALKVKPLTLISTDSILIISPTAATSYFAYSTCDTIEVTISVFDPIKFNFGKDVSFCQGDSIRLEAFVNYANYKWQDGSINSFFTVRKTGLYYLKAEINNCYSYTDSIYVNVKPYPVVNFKETSKCDFDTIKLNAYNEGATYLWEDGSRDPVKYEYGNGFYAYTHSVTVNLNGCIINKNVGVMSWDIPTINLGKDTTICEGQVLKLNVIPQSYASSIYKPQYLWQDQSTKDTFSITKKGTYWVKISSPTTPVCTYIDTINVDYKEVPSKMNLGNDTTLCADIPLLLTAKVPQNVIYQWSNGSKEPQITISKAGFYKVKLTGNGCYQSDSIRVNYYKRILLDLGKDRIIYKGQRIVLDAGNKGAKYIWQDGSVISKYEVYQEGQYWVTVSNDDECSVTDTITILAILLDMPNVFTPTGDGVNDHFVPMAMSGIKSAELSIYNRWATLVYRTNHLMQGWDGDSAAEGSYFWDIQYTDMNGVVGSQKGELTLIR